MKVEITLDNVDGSKSLSKTFNLDGTGLSQLVFELMNPDVLGCTICKKNVLKPLAKMEGTYVHKT